MTNPEFKCPAFEVLGESGRSAANDLEGRLLSFAEKLSLDPQRRLEPLTATREYEAAASAYTREVEAIAEVREKLESFCETQVDCETCPVTEDIKAFSERPPDSIPNDTPLATNKTK